ncbi:penicillin-binding protein 1C [Legionella worsleiensis]|uniref:peptidoglycan glycosyltransferase n=1 Tax=Legionella worsleiensis TaxID=45076 RepID=A0A0W1A6P7_9GAMM|nr:penicillin-binding protein 1C [Legionella worsleiensis]KTD76982.1 penicillin binding protein 1C [Legionella worsleiensis]STY33346.1 penicillin binding protein 1C [Legionella worsleiensis]
MKKIIQRIGILLALLFFTGYLTLLFLPKPLLLEGISFSKAVYDEKQKLLRLTLSKDEKYRLFTPLSDISPKLIEATLLQEDQYFRWHPGFNPFSLFKAIWQTYGVQSRRIGASTITMQVARMRFGINSRTISGKLLQLLRAIQLEVHYTKNELLEAYLNMAPYGGNIEGVGAASLVYFNKPVQNLSLPDALTLSIIPQNPGKRIPGNTDLQTIRNHLYTRWLTLHPEDIDKKETLGLPMTMRQISDLPFSAPHFVTMVLHNSTDQQHSIITSLDSRAQTIINRVTKKYLERKKSIGVTNAAVLLVDTRNMTVSGLLGSADFFNKKISGQINGTDIKRSPGSALKPFIYGLALDQGLIHPATVLKDVPHSFNGYNPENFDYDFMGPVSATDALVLSRNIPAVYLSSQLKSPTLHQLLEQAQVSSLKPQSHYGLSLNLGGIELTMRELVGLYAMLVNDGVWYPIRFSADEKQTVGRRLLSPEASFLVLDMLKSNPHGHLGDGSPNQLPVSWKTGTSSGYRDAWTIGAFGPYVMAVWLGNFDGKANPAFIGKDLAAPLFFELMDAIKHERGPLSVISKNTAAMNLERVEICKASGMLPTRYCHDRDWTWFIPGKSPIKTDNIFREVAVNNKTGLRTCHIDENTHFEIFEFWPSDVLRIFRQAGIQRRSPPFVEADCALSGNSGMNPQITSPQAGISYVVRANSSVNNQIPFAAVSDAGIAYLYWFIDETFVAKTKAGQTFFWNAKPGSYVVRVVDDHGLSDARDIRVLMDT